MEEGAPLLVLMPGLDGTGLLFSRFVSELPREIRTRIIVYPDGIGMSIEEHAAVARGLIPKEKVILLAESFSGLVAMNLLRSGDVAVEKVIFVASFAQSPSSFLKLFSGLFPLLSKAIKFIPKIAWRIFCLERTSSDAEIDQLKSAIAQVTPATIAARLKLVASVNATAGEPLCVPAYYIEATRDRLVPKTAGNILMSQFKQCILLPVAGPHFLLQAAPEECAKLVAAIVRGNPEVLHGNSS